MKANEQKNNNKVTGARIAVEAIVAIIGLAGLVLLAGDEAPNAAAPMTLGEWLAIKAAGAILVEAKEESESASALKYQPVAIAGQNVVIEPKSNLIVDAWVIAVTTGHALPSCIRKSLTGVVNY